MYMIAPYHIVTMADSMCVFGLATSSCLSLATLLSLKLKLHFLYEFSFNNHAGIVGYNFINRQPFKGYINQGITICTYVTILKECINLKNIVHFKNPKTSSKKSRQPKFVQPLKSPNPKNSPKP